MFVKTIENNDAVEKLFFRYEIEQKVKQLADIYKAIIPGNKGPISVNLSGHQIIIEHLLGMRVCFGCSVIYLESHYIYVEGKMRIIALLKFIIQNMYNLRTAMNAIMSSSGLEEKKENVTTEIVKQSAKPMITDLMLNTGLEYTLKAKAYYITLNIAVGPNCHKEFKFSYDWFAEDYEYAKDWLKGIQPGPMK